MFTDGNVKKIRPASDIHVPHLFFKIVISNHDHEPVAFLFKHDKSVKPVKSGLENWIVSVDEIEKLTGLDFFSTLSKTEQNEIEQSPNDLQWRRIKEMKE